MANLTKIVATTDKVLRERAARAPDHEGENEALRSLEGYSPTSRHCFKSLVRTGDACPQCGIRRVSLLKSPDDDTDFLWLAITELWAAYEGGGMPRSASPCGVLLQHDQPLIFHDIVKQFPAAAVSAIADILFAPFGSTAGP